MMNRFRSLIIVFYLFPLMLKANEGMWMLPLIENLIMPDMQQMGLKLTAEEIYSINNSSLKDAVVIFGGGCTGEIVSENGLLFTNHHCGQDQIQNHSSVEHNYLDDGFWAASYNEELPNPDLRVKFLRRIEDVTGAILSHLSDSMTESDRRLKIQEIADTLKNRAAEGDKYEAVVKSFYNGNEYYLMVYEVYRDVRLVGTPPSSIGDFGYDSDNWEWPRHTGDFSIFRVYTAPDGSPAEYSSENVPMKPKYYLPISIKGLDEGDFAMILGYPGSTQRYSTSFAVRETMEIENMNRIKVRGTRLDLLMEDMQKDSAVWIKYATKYSRSSNYWKYSIGQNSRIRALNVIEDKRAAETEFQKWVESDTLRAATYGNILKDIEANYSARRKAMMNLDAMNEALLSASELIGFAFEFAYLYNMLAEGSDPEDINEEVSQLKKVTFDYFKEYNLSTDLKVTKAMFALYKEMVPKKDYPNVFIEIEKKYKGSIDKFVSQAFKNSIFTDQEKVMTFLENPTISILNRDKGFKIALSIFSKFYEEYLTVDSYNTELQKSERLYLKAWMEMEPERFKYPDANFTMRLTYGTVEKYSPRDAVHYDAFTTIKGIMEKEDPTNYEFMVPEKLKELYRNRDYGRYGINDSIMPVCFITNLDITGGNSGSPVINDSGELVGLAFDGNWEAMSGDIKYETDLQRCICVDIRFVLFIIEKYAGAHNLIEELKILN